MADERELVVEERLVSPSKVTPTLFVGLGGCGLKMVARVKKHLRARPDYEQRFKALTKFVAVDTNIHDLQDARDLMDETILLSDFEKQDYARMANGEQFLEPDEYFTQWVPKDYRFRVGDVAGAGQIRIESRLGLYYQVKHRDVLARFRQLLEALKNHEHGHRNLEGSEIRIVLCYSVAGGTGSGSHLPLAYLLRDIAVQLGKPRLFGVAVLPSVFEDKTGRNKDGIFANGYAALKEMEHLMKLNAPDRINPVESIPFHYNPADPSRRAVSSGPFEFVYLIDRPERFAVQDVPGAAADGLYLQFFSPIFGHQAANYDNYTQWQRELVPLDFKEKQVEGFSTFYGSFGAAALLVPTDGLIDYSTRRAALTLLRRNLLREIPAAPHFENLRQSGEFDRVKIPDDNSSKQWIDVHVKDLFGLKGPKEVTVRRALYLKRIRLLAKAEYEHGVVVSDFFNIWKHGQHARVHSPDVAAESNWAEMGALPESGGNGSTGTQDPIVRVVEKLIGPLWTSAKPEGDIFMRAVALASTMMQNHTGHDEAQVAWTNSNAKQALKRALAHGSNQTDGFNLLTSGDFLTKAGATDGVDWRAKRYAIGVLLESPRLNPDRKPNELKEPALEKSALPEVNTTWLNTLSGTANTIQNNALQAAQAQKEAEIDAWKALLINYYGVLATEGYYEQLRAFKAKLLEMESTLASFDEHVVTVDGEEVQRLEDLIARGSSRSNQYELDAEALQMESGRRLWDFYYFDKWSTSPDLDTSTREVQGLVSQFFSGSDEAQGRGVRRLRRLLTDFQKYADRFIRPDVEGVRDAKDPDRRDGYTLDKALRDEVLYRALYLSNADAIREHGSDHVSHLLSTYKALPEVERARLSGIGSANLVNRAYLRDKIQRVVTERANLLCYVNESLTLQGGVRPCDEFVALYDPDLKDSELYKLAREVGSGLQWVESDVPNPKEMIFYRARLNLPMYAFARLSEMRSNYLDLKRSTIRPKVLHIDKNWEGSLPDLDPDAAIEFFNRQSLRRQVIGFASLMVAHAALREVNVECEPIIHHSNEHSGQQRDDSYWIIRPLADPSGESAGGIVRSVDDIAKSGDSESRQLLGHSLREAIARMPEVLSRNPVRYEPYQSMINKVHHGFAPMLLTHVVEQAFVWKTQHDSLRERYGVGITPQQHVRLEDLRQTYEQLSDALRDLRRYLLERRDEHSVDRIDSRIGGNTESVEVTNLQSSMGVLDDFDERWKRLMDPTLANKVSPVFAKLFEPHSTTRKGGV